MSSLLLNRVIRQKLLQPFRRHSSSKSYDDLPPFWEIMNGCSFAYRGVVGACLGSTLGFIGCATHIVHTNITDRENRYSSGPATLAAIWCMTNGAFFGGTALAGYFITIPIVLIGGLASGINYYVDQKQKPIK